MKMARDLESWGHFDVYLKVGHWEITPKGLELIVAHFFAAAGFYLILSGENPVVSFVTLLGVQWGINGIGGAAGVHRYFCHRSFKAGFPLRLLFIFFQTMTGFDSVYQWSRDHRLHHKYSETDADPSNTKRGVFFAQIGYMMVKQHPDVAKKAKQLDFSDLLEDPLVAFQHKWIYPLQFVFVYVIPIWILYNYWVPSVPICFCINYFRFVFTAHSLGLGNSLAHSDLLRKPYEKSIRPVDISLLSVPLFGEGWHNFHHVFPYDYRGTDVGSYHFNMATVFIDICAKMGLAYDLKMVPEKVIRGRALRTGDGSHYSAEIKKKEEDEEKLRKVKMFVKGTWGILNLALGDGGTQIFVKMNFKIPKFFTSHFSINKFNLDCFN